MFGLFYLAWAGISHIGYRVKELVYNSNAKITEDGTYYSYDGRERDANTNKVVTWFVDSNGDEVLWDRPGHVYRNLSEEKRQKAYAIAKKERKDDGTTVFMTGQRRQIKYKDEDHNEKCGYGMIFKDLETGMEYASRYINVRYHGMKGESVEFYVKASDPYCLVRITDAQKRLEKVKEKNGHYSWTKYPDDEKWFIKMFNNEPVTLTGMKSSLFSFSR